MVNDTLLYPKRHLVLHDQGWRQNDHGWWRRTGTPAELEVAEACGHLFLNLGRESDLYSVAGAIYARNANTAVIFDQEAAGIR